MSKDYANRKRDDKPKAKSPAFRFYPADYLADENTAAFTLEEEGAYLRALCFCWREGSVPADPIRLAKMIGKGCSEDAARVVQACFKQSPSEEGRLVHPRLELEREKQIAWRTKSSEGGKKSAEGKRHQALEQSRGGSILVEPKPNISLSSSLSLSNNNIYTQDNLNGSTKSQLKSNHPSTKSKFNPEGKKKYLDWVYLSDQQFERVKGYYQTKGLDRTDFDEAVRELDQWFSNNQGKRSRYVDDAKILMGWPLDRALQRRANLSRIQNLEARK